MVNQNKDLSNKKQPMNPNDIIPYVILGVSIGALGLSVYAVTGGPVDNYLASRQEYVVYADANELPDNPVKDSDMDDDATYTVDSDDQAIGEGDYDVVVKIDEDGERQYVLTPKDESTGDGDDSDETATDSDSDLMAKPDDTDDDDRTESTDDVVVDQPDDEDIHDVLDDSTDVSDSLGEESQAKLEEHKSMRLRMRPDRHGDDIYYYVIEEGDTLQEISDYFGIPIGQLLEDNYIEDADYIYVGEVIFMPTGFEK